MSETKETDNKTAGRRTMTLGVKRTVEQGHIRQNFSHGRSKSVLVETKRKRPGPAGVAEEARVKAPEPQKREPRPEPRVFQKPAAAEPGDKRAQKVLRQLSAGEVDARARALIEARKRENVEKREREAEETQRQEIEQQRALEEAKLLAEQAALRTQEEAAAMARAEAEGVPHTPQAAQTEDPVAEDRPRANGVAESREADRPGARATADETRPQPAQTARDGQRERVPARDAGRTIQRPASRDGAVRDGQRPPAREGSRDAAGPRPGEHRNVQASFAKCVEEMAAITER